MRNLDRIKVNYQKLPVSECKKAKHHIQLSRLKELAPYDSRIHVNFEPRNGLIRGQLKVIAKRRQFESLVLSPEVDVCMKRLIKAVDQQILEWKRTRFNGNSGHTPAPIMATA